jgi:hypothetical protein
MGGKGRGNEYFSLVVMPEKFWDLKTVLCFYEVETNSVRPI